MRWLLLSAFEPESSPLRSRLGDVGDVSIATTGIGLVDAAIGADQAIDQHPFAAVVFVGTCGAFEDSGLAIGDVVVSRTVKLVSSLHISGAAAFPDAMARGAVSDTALVQGFVAGGCRQVDVATTLAITTNDESAASLATEADVEHLESFAVARAATMRQQPFVAVLGVANMVGSNGRREWKENHTRVSELVAERVARVIASWPKA